MNILVTGAAGFIGFHLCNRLLEMGHSVVGLDNVNDYYSVQLKEDRISLLEKEDGFKLVRMDLADESGMANLFKSENLTHVINLAGQAGVRYSLENPSSYVKSNVAGFLNILEGCRHHDIEHLVYASSSSVYGLNTTTPFGIHQNVDHPISLYAATKKADELMAHTYSHLYGVPTTGLRFFSVYGPWGRPDMVAYLWTKAILEDSTIKVFNYGKMRRSFTYVSDIVEGVVRVLQNTASPNPEWTGQSPDPGTSASPYRIYNIGNSSVVELSYFLEILEGLLGKKAVREDLPIQPGDVPDNAADVSDLVQDVGYNPSTSIETGLANFVAWYKEYHNVK
ncbi:MAG: NAD-dependent epimerase [Candidatus Latescibacteria bacterium]|nr:NAD-dependent epimerase [Candidatus Latescibacterota bacterium]